MKDRIKQLRNELGYTQADFAEKIGMKRNSIAMVESGERNLSSPAITAICTVFNVNEEWLRTGEGEMFEELSQDEELAEFLADIQKSDDADPVKQIILAFMKLSKEQQEDFKENLGAIIENLHK